MPDAAKLVRPGSPAGKRYDAWLMMNAVRNCFSAGAMMFSRTNKSSSAEYDGWIVLERAEVTDAFGRQRHHLAQPLFVRPCEDAQPTTQIVMQHEVPAAEQLLSEELGDAAVASLLFLRRITQRHQVERVAVAARRRMKSR